MAYWLIKSEPETYSIQDLQKDSQTIWDGVRNYQARNFLRQMQVGDRAFFYHSNTKIPAIVGLVTICEASVVDPTQFEPESPYYDAKATPDNPRWHTVKVEFSQVFSTPIPLAMLKEKFSPEDLLLIRRGNRLSVMPVPLKIAQEILAI